MSDYIITTEEVDANKVKSAANHITGSNVQDNKNIFDRLPELIVRKFNEFVADVVEKFGEYYTKEETDDAIKERIIHTGNGNMLMEDYGGSSEGTVKNADNLGNKPADQFITKAGGVFEGDVVACSENRSTASLRNIEIRTTSTEGPLQSTNKIILIRK